MIEFTQSAGKGFGDLLSKADPYQLKQALHTALEKIGRLIDQRAVDNNGQRPGPFVHTDKLRGSINHKVAPDALSVVIGASAEYAPRLELGYHKQESVKSHQRKITQAWGKPIQGGPKTITVKAFTREANTPAYPFLRPAFDSAMREKIVEEFLVDELSKIMVS